MEIKELIDRINDSLVEVISHFIEVQSHGHSHKACCPFHNEKTPSLSISESRCIWKCFGCGKGGDAVAFIMQHEKVEFMDSLKIAARKLNLQVDWNADRKDFNTAEYQHKESLRVVCGMVASFYQVCLAESTEALQYLAGRNTTTNATDPLMIGYAPNGNVLLKWASENNISPQLLKESGLVQTNDSGQDYDFFRHRIMFPICEKTGKVIGFTGRSIADKKGVAKYMNSTETEIFHKGGELYGLHTARRSIKDEMRVYLVEGNFDVKRLHSIGVTNVVAPCGTALTVDQIKLLKNYTKNVTLIYDGDTAGRKAIDHNGQLLVHEQFNVMVMAIPDNQDPDSLFTSIQKFDEFKEKSNTDFIIYKTLNGVEICKNPSSKSQFIQQIASLVIQYDEPSLHEVYLEALSSIIKPKKAWQDQFKILVAEKTPVERKHFIPEGISAAELDERGFYENLNCYYFKDTKGIPIQRSNFVLTPLFHIESTINAKRLFEVKNINGIQRVIEIPQKDMVSLTAFQIHCESLGDFWFDGSQSDLNRLKRWLYSKTQSAKEIIQLGWQKEGFWAWGNGIFNAEFTSADSYGITKHGNHNYYIPAFSSIYEKEENLYQFERKFIHIESNITLKEYAHKFVHVFGDNAKIGLCFFFASLFRDIIVRRFSFFPILNMFGPKGAGKSACAESLTQLFGRLAKAPNIHNTTKAALGDHMASSCNAMAHIEEYRNDLEMEKREFVKGMWDGVGRTRMNMDKDKKRETTSVDQSLILTGQQMATADIALFSRFIFLAFTQIEFTDQEATDFNNLKDLEKRGLTQITHQVLKLREPFKENYPDKLKQVNDQMHDLLGNQIIESRIFNNWLIPLSVYSTLSYHLDLPWNETELIKMGVALMIAQNRETKKNDDLGNFWKVVQYLISSNMLFEDGDYKVIYEDKITHRYFKDMLWYTEVINLEKPVDILYITMSRVFSLYKQQCLREGDKPLPESTIEYYLRNSPAFICETKKESFKKIDPKTGFQECTADGKKKRTSTSALIFNLSKTGLMVSSTEEYNASSNAVLVNKNQLSESQTTINLPF